LARFYEGKMLQALKDLNIKVDDVFTLKNSPESQRLSVVGVFFEEGYFLNIEERILSFFINKGIVDDNGMYLPPRPTNGTFIRAGDDIHPVNVQDYILGGWALLENVNSTCPEIRVFTNYDGINYPNIYDSGLNLDILEERLGRGIVRAKYNISKANNQPKRFDSIEQDEKFLEGAAAILRQKRYSGISVDLSPSDYFSITMTRPNGKELIYLYYTVPKK
jgi:hypothetical protein